MVEENLKPISTTTRSGEKNQGQLRIIFWSKEERLKRALKAAGIGLGLTFIFIFLPIVHFILVPLALIITPLVSVYLYKQTEEVPKQNLICPKCAANVEVSSSNKFEKIELICDSCRSVLEISAN
ncbi:MAG: hypothetical protein J0L93_02785 [Deltaproteobacteria bacterium]|nr:hypothetical protein [Deltaproteobacteria bacterium]